MLGTCLYRCEMVSVLTSSAVDCGSSQIKEYKICIYSFFTKHPALRSESKDWLARDQDNMSEWSNITKEVSFLKNILFAWNWTNI
jgi:hypothetical protein